MAMPPYILGMSPNFACVASITALARGAAVSRDLGVNEILYSVVMAELLGLLNGCIE